MPEGSGSGDAYGRRCARVLVYLRPGRILDARSGEVVADLAPTLSSHVADRLGREMAAGPTAVDLLRRLRSQGREMAAAIAALLEEIDAAG